VTRSSPQIADTKGRNSLAVPQRLKPDLVINPEQENS